MKRRKFILISSAGAAYAGLGSCTFFRKEIKAEILGEPVFLQLIWDENTMSSIGERYAKNYPEDDYKKHLDKLITESRSDPEAVKNRLREIINKDFAKEETVMLNGWLLSRTEARQCAIYSQLNT